MKALASPSSRRIRLLVKAVEGFAARPDASGDTWSVGNVNAAPEDPNAASSSRARKDLVRDTLAAFQGVLRQTDEAESAPDALGTPEAATPGPEDLDYFAPAFRRVLGDETTTPETDARRTADDAGRSLDDFAPGFRAVLGREESRESGPEKTSALDDAPGSFDYFTPALP